MPRYGGFCTYGIATEKSDVGWPWDKHYLGPPGDPNNWTIIEDKLYIVYLSELVSEISDKISDADDRWSNWWGDDDDDDNKYAGPFNTDCLGPSKKWCNNNCGRNPQKIPGVKSNDPIISEDSDCYNKLIKHIGYPSDLCLCLDTTACEQKIKDTSGNFAGWDCPADASGINSIEKYFCW